MTNRIQSVQVPNSLKPRKQHDSARSCSILRPVQDTEVVWSRIKSRCCLWMSQFQNHGGGSTSPHFWISLLASPTGFQRPRAPSQTESWHQEMLKWIGMPMNEPKECCFQIESNQTQERRFCTTLEAILVMHEVTNGKFQTWWRPFSHSVSLHSWTTLKIIEVRWTTLNYVELCWTGTLRTLFVVSLKQRDLKAFLACRP